MPGMICMAGYNDVKKEILAILDEMGELTAREAAGIVGRSHESVAMALLRYHRQGLVSRYTREGKTRVYKLTDKGVERLEYLPVIVSTFKTICN